MAIVSKIRRNPFIAARTAKRSLAMSVTAFLVSGCGVTVPGLLEPWENPDEAPLFVKDLQRSIHCELINSIAGLMHDDDWAARQNHQPRQLAWLDNWGVQTSLSLNVEEKSSIAPSATFTHLMGDAVRYRDAVKVVTSRNRTLGIGGALTSTATRINKTYSFFTIPELRADPTDCRGLRRGVFSGSLLLQDDLHLREWLSDVALSKSTGDTRFIPSASAPFNQNAISHEVKFQVVSSGNVTPAWKFVNLAVNPTSPLFSTSRDRTHDLIITLGPTTVIPPSAGQPKGLRQLAPVAANAANNADIAASISNGIRNAIQFQ